MALKIRQLCFVMQIQIRRYFNSYFLFFLLCIGVMIPQGNVWAQCNETVISSDTTAGQSNSSSLCRFTVSSGISHSINSSYGVSNTSTITTFNNSGLISISGPGSPGIINSSLGTITTLTNAGVISTSGSFGPNGNSGFGILNSGTTTTLNNTGLIATSGSSAYGINNSTSGRITTFNNSGVISTSSSSTAGFYNRGIVTTLTNTGRISASGLTAYGIRNDNTLTTLNNLQGASGSPLTYRNILPTNYNIIINSDSNFGKLAVTSGTGSTNFGIYTDSTLSATTYSSVLTGVASSNITNYSSIFNTWNNFSSSYKWELVQGGSETTWDLVVAARASNIQSGSTNLLSSVGGGLNPVLDGGTLKIDSATTTSTAFTIKSTGGKIDTSGLRVIFSGAFSDVSGESGKLTIANTGTAGQGAVVLSTANTHSGGTEVQAGAVLSIASSDALGSGTLALVGSSTVPATLTTTATTTISNAITVTGDPVFNVASGTTTTVSSAIIDGVSAGDVVVSGGGTLALTAANTYTGNTTVDSGSTLVLSGSGSIATSGTDATIGTGVFNNGAFNITGVSANTVSLGKNYTQSSTGTLAMNFSPSSNQKLSVTGVASLGGTLALTASSGTYSAGKYTLLTASSVSGTFASLSTNLGAYTNLGYSLTYDNSNVYLYFTPNLAHTQASLHDLKGTYALQTSAINIGLTYDCNTFDSNKICVSTGGRYARVSTGDNSTNGLLIGAYKLNDKVRLGAYLDQNLSSSNAASGINLSNSNPLFGVFGVWNHQADQLGYSVRVAAGYGDRDLSLTRQVIGTSEAGSGSTRLNSQAASITGSYTLPVHSQWIASPFVGIRYTKVSSSAYSEQATITVTSPLTFDSLVQETTTALAGVKLSGNLMPKIGLFGSVGIEQDLNNHGDNYSATGITGLTAINFNPNLQKTRPVANLGASYQIDKTQQISFNAIYRQEAFQSTNTLTSLVTYTAGF